MRATPAVLPARALPPERVTFHLGPTNSGKTHDALAALAGRGRGTYAAPLRQLAQEAYSRLSTLLPAGTVGLSTGEESIDPSAPVLCCTVEKAPPAGDVLVLDESHWVTDPERGHVWARLLLTGNYREVHVISAAEALPVLEPLVEDAAAVEVVDHIRLSRLDVLRAPVRPAGVRPQTLVVAFSRKAVYAVAAVLDAARPGRVGVLYGALPPATRRELIARFVRGDLDVLVTTDVIGHGINVPARTVLFAETSKYDGFERRPLRTWEAAQIAGRAGRYGLAGHGTVGVLAGVPGLRPDAALVAAGAAVARGDRTSDLPLRVPRLRPDLADLDAAGPADLPAALTRWAARTRRATREAAVTGDDVSALVERAEALLPLLEGPVGDTTDLATVWRLVTLPIDHDPRRRTRWLPLARAALLSAAGARVAPHLVLPAAPRRGPVEDFEQAAAAARDAATLLRSFPGVAGLTAEDAAAVEAACATRITALLPRAIAAAGAAAVPGRCARCGVPVAPRFPTCRSCAARSSAGPRARGDRRTGSRPDRARSGRGPARPAARNGAPRG
ncbi:helicase-related protein [Blastococcus sp. SYSU D00820]